MSRTLQAVIVLLVIAVLVLLAGAAFLSQLSQPYGQASVEPVIVTIPTGASGRQIAQQLESAGLIRSARWFAWFLRFSGGGTELKAGEYAFRPPLSPVEIARILARGEMNLVSVTIPEGLTLDETSAAIAASGLAERAQLDRAFRDPKLVADLDPQAKDLEGYLFPETYRFAKGVTAQQVTETLVTTFRVRFEHVLSQARQSGLVPRAVRELVTIGSLVEKETSVPEERRLVAGVIEERLSRKMLLQIDPTVIYARKLAGNWDGNIRKVDLSWDHAYNTYVRGGLPPGPIASPGLGALQAAVTPDRKGWLYYCSTGQGKHVFSATYAEHLRAVRRYQLGAR